MASYKRFPIPEFDRDALKNMNWAAPEFLSASDAENLISKRRSGDTGAVGCYPVMPNPALFDKLSIEGEHRHAVLCILPKKEVSVFGRSFAWKIQHAWVLDSKNPEVGKVLISWETVRPMNTRLGPDNGVTIEQPAVFMLCGNRFGKHWIGNRTLLQPEWRREGASGGFAILSSSNPDSKDFHDCNLYFYW